uniref:DUF2637 domain-containing protein n=1 Tax=Paractinoplanes polyasparticus TaxID=2856853 RepID=UPI001C8616BE|nr:DUF2637 domain-containing protein [Actinoplanes polyasparticus]
MTPSPQRWTRWAVRLTLTAGVAASVTANILHARDNLISQAIAAWPPLALLVTVELVTRIPVLRKTLGVLRIAATSAIAAIAAWISYHHMVGVVARYGETGTVPYLLPLSVDGLIVVASISLIELSGRPDPPPPPAPAGTTTTAAETPATPMPAAPLPAPATTPPSPTAQADPEPVAEPVDQPATAPEPEQPSVTVDSNSPARTDPPPGDRPDLSPDHDEDQDGEDEDHGDQDPDGENEDHGDEDDDGVDLAPDLVPLLPAARTARDELIREGRTVSRDALAQRLRRNGAAIRNNRVSELLNALRREEADGASLKVLA